MANLSFSNVGKQYPGSESLLEDFNLEVAEGEFLVLVGPSGCGKSTLLRMAAGLEETTSGAINIGGQNVTDWTPQKRNIAMVFQNYALYPHMTVRGNLAYPLKMRHTPRAEIKKRVQDISELLGLETLLNRKPSQLSGGQSQRVAMGRALVRDPDVFLMDEPLSNLDAKLRMRLRAEIAELQNRSGKTTLYVTHDQTEAMTLGDRVAILKDGVLMQVGSPQTLYDQPANTFVAEFMGSPPMNLLPARLAIEADGSILAQLGEQAVELANSLDGAKLQSQVGQNVTLGIRPEHLTLNNNEAGTNALRVSVTSREYLGHETLLGVRILDYNTETTGSDMLVRVTGAPKLPPQDQITIHLPSEKLCLFDPHGLNLKI